jgi:hypothetical protein
MHSLFTSTLGRGSLTSAQDEVAGAEDQRGLRYSFRKAKPTARPLDRRECSRASDSAALLLLAPSDTQGLAGLLV